MQEAQQTNRFSSAHGADRQFNEPDFSSAHGADRQFNEPDFSSAHGTDRQFTFLSIRFLYLKNMKKLMRQLF